MDNLGDIPHGEPAVEKPAPPLLTSAQALAKEIAAFHPQVDPSGRVNYYFAGSLATDLLAGATEIEILNTNALPQPSANEKREIPLETRELLQSAFLRQVGDLDYVQFPHYPEEYPLEERLGKGGGGGRVYDTLSDLAKAALKQDGMPTDPLDTPFYGVARVYIGGAPIYIAEPASILAFKAVHVADGFYHAEKTAKLIRDFPVILDAISGIYPAEELAQHSLDALLKYAVSPNMLLIPYDNPDFSPEMRLFFDEVLASAPDATYLQQFRFSEGHDVKTRAIGILNILNHFDQPEDKARMVEFMNTHVDQIDVWVQNETSVKNRAIAAAFIANHPDVLQDFLNTRGPGRIEGYKQTYGINPDGSPRIDAAVVEDIFNKGLTWRSVIRSYEKHPDFPHDQMELQPAASELMDILAEVIPTNIEGDLQVIDQVPSAQLFSLRRLLRAGNMQDTPYRRQVLERVGNAISTLDPADFDKFLYRMSQIMDLNIGSGMYDSSNYEYKVLESEGMRTELIKTTFAEFGLPQLPETSQTAE